MASITRVTLLRNTENDVNTATSIDITSEFLGSVTPTINDSTIAYQGANVTQSGLAPDTTYWMWLEVEDGAGNVTVQVLGSIKTALPMPLLPYPPTSLHSFTLSLNNDTATVSGMAYGNGDYYVGWNILENNYSIYSTTTPRSAFSYSMSTYWWGSKGSSLTGGYENDDVQVSIPGPLKVYFVRMIFTNSMYTSGEIPSRVGISGQNNLNRFSWTGVGGGDAVYEQYELNGELVWKADFPVRQATYYYYKISVGDVKNGAYPSYFRVPWIQFWGHTEITRIVPTLSSPTSDGCVATWSSQWRVGQEGWRVFDRINDANIGGWAAQRDAPFPHWVAIELPEPKMALRFRLWNVDIWANFKVKTFEIQGRNGEDPWDVLGEYTNVSYTTITPSEKQTHPQYQEDILSSGSGNAYMFEANLTSTGAYKHYRIVTETLDTGGLTVTLGEWVLLGYE